MTITHEGETILLDGVPTTYASARAMLRAASVELDAAATAVSRARQVREQAEALAAAKVEHAHGWTVPSRMGEGWAWIEGDQIELLGCTRDGAIRVAPAGLLWRAFGGRTLHVGSCPKLDTWDARVETDPKWRRCACVGNAR